MGKYQAVKSMMLGLRFKEAGTIFEVTDYAYHGEQIEKYLARGSIKEVTDEAPAVVVPEVVVPEVVPEVATVVDEIISVHTVVPDLEAQSAIEVAPEVQADVDVVQEVAPEVQAEVLVEEVVQEEVTTKKIRKTKNSEGTEA
jgi:hypothetical protein